MPDENGVRDEFDEWAEGWVPEPFVTCGVCGARRPAPLQDGHPKLPPGAVCACGNGLAEHLRVRCEAYGSMPLGFVAGDRVADLVAAALGVVDAGPDVGSGEVERLGRALRALTEVLT